MIAYCPACGGAVLWSRDSGGHSRFDAPWGPRFAVQKLGLTIGNTFFHGETRRGAENTKDVWDFLCATGPSRPLRRDRRPFPASMDGQGDIRRPLGKTREAQASGSFLFSGVL